MTTILRIESNGDEIYIVTDKVVAIRPVETGGSAIAMMGLDAEILIPTHEPKAIVDKLLSFWCLG